VGNLFDVKLRAIENLYNNGVDIVPVVTIINGVNNDKSTASSNSPSTIPRRSSCRSSRCRSRAGRSDAGAERRRYAVPPRARREGQTGIGEPVSTFPISFMGSFTDWADVTHGAERNSGG
jgi:uncharacterized radical SAM superfamily Fe-S cluster-containing enzyme